MASHAQSRSRAVAAVVLALCLGGCLDFDRAAVSTCARRGWLTCLDDDPRVMTVALTGATRPTRIATAGGALFWTNWAGWDEPGGLWRVGPETGATPLLTAVGTYAIAADETHLYWSTEKAVHRRPVGSGAPVELAAVGNGQITDLALSVSHVYFVEFGFPGRLHRVPKVGGPVELLLETDDRAPYAITTDSTHLYFANFNALELPQIVKLPLEGGTPVTLVSGIGEVDQLTTHADQVYWTVADHGDVFRTPKAGGANPQPIYTEGQRPLGIAVDDSGIYWTDLDSFEVRWSSLALDRTEVIAEGEPGPQDLVLLGDRVYWTGRFSGEIRTALKPR